MLAPAKQQGLQALDELESVLCELTSAPRSRYSITHARTNIDDRAERLHRFCPDRPAIVFIPRIEGRLTRAGRFPMEGPLSTITQPIDMPCPPIFLDWNKDRARKATRRLVGPRVMRGALNQRQD